MASLVLSKNAHISEVHARVHAKITRITGLVSNFRPCYNPQVLLCTSWLCGGGAEQAWKPETFPEQLWSRWKDLPLWSGPLQHRQVAGYVMCAFVCCSMMTWSHALILVTPVLICKFINNVKLSHQDHTWWLVVANLISMSFIFYNWIPIYRRRTYVCFVCACLPWIVCLRFSGWADQP